MLAFGTPLVGVMLKDAPLHIVCEIFCTTGLGFTVITELNVLVQAPATPAVAVIVKVAVCTVFVGLLST